MYTGFDRRMMYYLFLKSLMDGNSVGSTGAT